MPTPCDCCDGRCQYCSSMGYTWENVTRIHGASGTNLGRHMKLHPCCKKQTKKAVVHPLTNRPLIVNALPVELQARILLHFGENPPQFHPFPRPLESIFEVQNDNFAEQDQEQENEALAVYPVYHADEADVYPQELPENLNVNIDEDIDFGDFPMDNAVDEEPNILPLQPIISPEDLHILQGQADESVTIQEALDVALLNVQTLTAERNAALNREARLAQSHQEAALNLRAQIQENENITAEKEVLAHENAETQRLFCLSLEAKTQENADLILQNQVIITERDNALESLAEELAVSKAKVIHLEKAFTDAFFVTQNM